MNAFSSQEQKTMIRENYLISAANVWSMSTVLSNWSYLWNHDEKSFLNS